MATFLRLLQVSLVVGTASAPSAPAECAVKDGSCGAAAGLQYDVGQDGSSSATNLLASRVKMVPATLNTGAAPSDAVEPAPSKRAPAEEFATASEPMELHMEAPAQPPSMDELAKAFKRMQEAESLMQDEPTEGPFVTWLRRFVEWLRNVLGPYFGVVPEQAAAAAPVTCSTITDAKTNRRYGTLSALVTPKAPLSPSTTPNVLIAAAPEFSVSLNVVNQSIQYWNYTTSAWGTYYSVFYNISYTAKTTTNLTKTTSVPAGFDANGSFILVVTFAPANSCVSAYGQTIACINATAVLPTNITLPNDKDYCLSSYAYTPNPLWR